MNKTIKSVTDKDEFYCGNIPTLPWEFYAYKTVCSFKNIHTAAEL